MQLNASSASVKSSRAALGSRTSTLSDIDEVAAMHAAQLSTVNSSLSNLQSRLSLALNTAAMVRVNWVEHNILMWHFFHPRLT